MITDVPTPSDFFDSGIELFDFAWNIVAELITNLADAEERFGVDATEVSNDYWDAAKRRLTTALAMTQQGVEFILKGKIAEVTPYLLLAEPPSRWPSPYDGHTLTFSEFKTVDAQDLVRIHDTVRAPRLPDEFVNTFNSLRSKRNTISHSVNKQLQVHTTEVIESILYLHKTLFPVENWAKIRARFINSYPDVALGSEFSRNHACRELEVVLTLLPPSAVKTFFGIDKKQRLYLCPVCIGEASSQQEFDHKLAALRPKDPTSTTLYCPICDVEHAVVRKDCGKDGCLGNVLSGDEDRCLTCGGYVDHG